MSNTHRNRVAGAGKWGGRGWTERSEGSPGRMGTHHRRLLDIDILTIADALPA